MRVLIVEDHEELAETVATGLRREGMAVDVAFDGDSGLYRAEINRYDVIILDRDLPGTHGDDVCRALTANGNQARVLMLTAAGTIADRVAGLDVGADDYLPKPFAFAELVARVRALTRRRARKAIPTARSTRSPRRAARRLTSGCGRCCGPRAASSPSSSLPCRCWWG